MASSSGALTSLEEKKDYSQVLLAVTLNGTLYAVEEESGKAKPLLQIKSSLFAGGSGEYEIDRENDERKRSL